MEAGPGNLSINALGRGRRRMLAGFLLGFAAWQLPQIIQEVWGEILPGYAEAALTAAVLAGAAGFFNYGWQIIQLRRLAEANPAVDEALNDERVRWLRLRALGAGFWALIIYLGAVRLAALVTELPAGAGPFMQLGIVVAAAGAIVAYLWLDREAAQ